MSKIDILQDGQYLIRSGNISFVVSPNLGARIISAKIDREEILLQERGDLLNWGSTFWLAPQSLWNWPPPEAIHLGKYKTEILGDTLILSSGIDPQFGLRVTKNLHYNDNDNCMEICYEVKNETDSAMQIGPWEVTVVPAEGAKVFYPSGVEPKDVNSNIQFDEVDAVEWFEYLPEKLDDWHKIFRIPKEGWMAHINDDRTLLVKTFETVSNKDLAPGHGNLEVYITKRSKYIELENHGKFSTLKPKESFEYNVNWYVTKLPEEISCDEYSRELVEYVDKLIN